MPSGGRWQRSTIGSSRQAHGKHVWHWGRLRQQFSHRRAELTVDRQWAKPWTSQKRLPALAPPLVPSALPASSAAAAAWSHSPVLHVQCDEQHISHNFDVRKGRIFTEFFKGGKTNVAYNCLDRFVLKPTTCCCCSVAVLQTHVAKWAASLLQRLPSVVHQCAD